MKYLAQHPGVDGDCVAVAEKYLFKVAEMILCHAYVGLDFVYVPDAVFLVLVHPAECARVMRTPDGALKQVAVRFAEWAEDVSFIAHDKKFPEVSVVVMEFQPSRSR